MDRSSSPIIALSARLGGTPQERSRTRWGTHLALIVICFILCIPALYALQVATLTIEQSFISPPQFFPPGGDLGTNLSILFTNRSFGQLILNTTIVSLVVVIGKTLLALMAGLAFVYYQFRGRNIVFFAVLLTLLMPTEIILIPLFQLVSQLDWINISPKLALTFPFLATASGVFLFRQHFNNIPRELAEAAQIDGATSPRFLFSILIPMSWNVIGAHAMIQFIYMWNQYLWPFIVISSGTEQVIQVGVRQTVNASAQTDFGLLMSAGVLASIPPLLLFVLLQKQFMNGFALTRDK